MAALSERDMRRILGDQYDSATGAGPVAEMAEKRKQRKDAAMDRQFTASAAMLMGVGLVVSAFYTAKGNAFYIQMAVAAVLIVAGGVWYAMARRQELKETV
jgi:hypothetical protein